MKKIIVLTGLLILMISFAGCTNPAGDMDKDDIAAQAKADATYEAVDRGCGCVPDAYIPPDELEEAKCDDCDAGCESFNLEECDDCASKAQE